jgi:hypothetical protein
MERVKKASTDQALLNCAPQLNGTSEEGKHRPNIAELRTTTKWNK